MSSQQLAAVCLKRYRNVPDCVVIVARGESEMSVRFRDYEQAARWARMECRSYRIAKYETVFEHLQNSSGGRGHPI
jgi:antibiotic biosynthesis monooxygenase (ABM) superfamily enzyme